jgi:hypothetical protein
MYSPFLVFLVSGHFSEGRRLIGMEHGGQALSEQVRGGALRYPIEMPGTLRFTQ